jgi:SM-20-related protein
MPTLETFLHLGLFGVRGFLDADACASIRTELRTSQMKPATVLSGGTFEVDENVRSTKFQHVSGPTADELHSRLTALKPQLEDRFALELAECKKPDFLAYEPGDFYKPHRDNSSTHAETVTYRRKVTIVVFLNGESATPSPDSYGGGALAFYGLMDDPVLKNRPLPLVSEPGLLIAFPAQVVHEVRPVTHGLRYTMVTWFY